MPPKRKRKANEIEESILSRSSKRLKDKLKNVKSSAYFEEKKEKKTSSTNTCYFYANENNVEVEQKKTTMPQSPESRDSDQSSDENQEWEEIEDAIISEDENELIKNYKPTLPKDGIDIVFKASNAEKKKKQKLTSDEIIRQQINRMKKTRNVLIHKAHLLCLLASGIHFNSLSLDHFISSLALSHLNNINFKVEKVTIKLIQDFSFWFKQHFQLKESKQVSSFVKQSIINSFQNFLITSDLNYVIMYLSCIRIWLPKTQFRFCSAINPISTKPCDLLLSDKQRQRQESSKKVKKSDNVGKPIQNTKTKKRKETSSNSMLNNLEENKTLKITEYWIEFYSDLEKRWICVDPVNLIFDEPKQIEKLTYNPLLYVIAFDNCNLIKEVTARYSSDWCSNKLQKMRVEKDWWKTTLKFFMSKKQTIQDKEENRQLEEALSLKPLPNNISDYKNHPLYVLNRHLLKYQVIYPKHSPIGYFRGEPVYLRNWVQPVHSKEYWKRQAKVIKINEEPFKISCGRKKWNKNSNSYITNQPQHLFGEWQTEPFMPPMAKDGKVPRSEFGNVELFQPCMLPIGCVHLRLPGLLRIANKLKIDCAPAVVGFDNNSSGGVIPVFDGFVVCEEFKDILIAAWDEEEENIKFRKKSVKERRALKNWKRLYKLLMIGERLKTKYKSEDNFF